jgi:hypothetical protein
MPVVVEHRKDVPEVFKVGELTGIRHADELKKALKTHGAVELKVNERVTFDLDSDRQISVGHTGGKREHVVITEARPLEVGTTVKITPEIGARVIGTSSDKKRLFLYNREDAGEIDTCEGFYGSEEIVRNRRRMESEEISRYGASEGYEYSVGGKKVYLFEFSSGIGYYKKKYGEEWAEPYLRERSLAEVILVNSLVRQSKAYERFGLGASEIDPFRGLRFNYDVEDREMISFLREKIWLPVFKKHIQVLKDNDCTLRDVMTEFTGHIIHEGIHGAGEVSTSFKPYKEFSSITGQMAYYLSEGYSKYSSYDTNVVENGLEAIKGKHDYVDDHETGSFAAATLLLRHLTAEFREVSYDDSETNPLVRCRHLCAEIRKNPENQKRLDNVLGNAIRDATEERFNEIVEQTRKQQ